MANEVVVNFQVGGIAQVLRAFETTEQAMLRAERNAEKQAAKSATARVRVAEKEAKEKQRILDRAARDQIKAYQKVDTELAKAQKAGVREVEKAEKDKTRIKEREVREQMRIWQRADRAEMQAKRAGAREAEQIRKQDEASAARWVRKREREQQSAARRDVMARERLSRGLGGAVSRGVSGAANAAIGMAGSVLSLGGGFSVADSVKDRLSLDLEARKLSNSAYIPGTNQRQDPGMIMNKVRASGIAHGLDPSDIMSGMQSYVAKSSDFEGGMKNMDFFAKLAKGTGTKFEDVTNAAGALKVQNKGLDDKSMQELMLSVVMQGKQGAVEFSDLARVAGQMTKTSSAYGMNQTDAQRELLGLGQIAMRTSGSPQESATVVSNFANDSLKHRKDISKVAGDITDKDGNLKDPLEILSQVFEKTGGNLGKIQDLGYGARSIKLMEALAPAYKESGVQGIRDEVKSLTGASYSMNTLDEDDKRIMDSPEEQFEANIRKLKDAVGTELTPALLEIIPKFRDALPALGDFVSKVGNVAAFMAKNPFTGMGALVTAFVVAELAKAAIGSAIATGLKTILANIGTGGGGFSMGKGGVGGNLAAAGAIAGAAVGATALGMSLIDSAVEGSAKGQGGRFGKNANAQNATEALLARTKAGTLTSEDVEAAKKLQATYATDVAKQKADAEPGAGERFLANGTGMFGSTAGAEAIQAQQEAAARAAKQLDELSEAIVRAAKKLDDESPMTRWTRENRTGPMGGAAREGAP